MKNQSKVFFSIFWSLGKSQVTSLLVRVSYSLPYIRNFSFIFHHIPNCEHSLALLKISVEQFPPNPKELDNTCLMGLRLSVVCGRRGTSGIGVCQFRLGHTAPSWIAKRLNIASTAEATAKVCPVKGFVELKSGTSSPKIRMRARPSERSLFTVAVPCALI